MSQEQMTTLDALDVSLQELTKAAQRVSGEPLHKGDGVNIDNSGTIGSDGKQGGGQGSMSDAGKVEDLMIGKLTAQGFNASQIHSILGMMKDVSSGELQGGKFFPHERPSPSGGKGGSGAPEGGSGGHKPKVPPFVGKGEEGYDEGEEEEGEEDEEQGPPVGMKGKRRMGKSASFDEQFRSDPDIGDVVDVSPFIESITARTTEALDELAGRMQKSTKRTDGQFVLLAKSLVAMGGLVKSQQDVIQELGKRLGVVERMPNPPKGATTSAQALEKSMPGEAGRGSNSLKKSEVTSVLTYMNLEKSIKEIGGRKIATEIVPLVESSAEVPEAVLGEVQNFLRRNPGEASLAKSYA